MTNNHTPAPWYINQFKGKFFRVSPNEFGCRDKSQCIAEQIKTRDDAHLIAAAPELLEALEECYRVFKMKDVDTALSLKCGMAISKAKGDNKRYAGE